MSFLIEVWKEISRKVVFVAKRYSIISVDFVRPGNEEYKDIFIKEESDAVIIFAVTKDQKVIMLRHFRPGPGKILLELIAGDIDVGEDIATAAARELLEETGFRGEEIVSTGSWYRDAYSTGMFSSVIITGCVCKEIPSDYKKHPGLREIVLIPIEEFQEVLKKEIMTNSEAGFRGLDYLGLNSK